MKRRASVQNVFIDIEFRMMMGKIAALVRIARAQIHERSRNLLAVVREILRAAARLEHLDVLRVEPDVQRRQKCPLRRIFVVHQHRIARFGHDLGGRAMRHRGHLGHLRDLGAHRLADALVERPNGPDHRDFLGDNIVGGAGVNLRDRNDRRVGHADRTADHALQRGDDVGRHDDGVDALVR